MNEETFDIPAGPSPKPGAHRSGGSTGFRVTLPDDKRPLMFVGLILGILLMGYVTITTPSPGPTLTDPASLAASGETQLSDKQRLEATRQALVAASEATSAQIRAKGGAQITAVSVDNSVVTARVGPEGQVFATTSNLDVPLVLRVGDVVYRGLSQQEQLAVTKKSGSLTNPAPLPAKWTTALKPVDREVTQYLALTDPAAFLWLVASKSTQVAPQDESAEESTILALVPASEWSSIPGLGSVKASAQSQPAVLQVQLDAQGALTRLLLVLPDERQFLLSVDKYAKQEILPPAQGNVRATVPAV